MFWMTPEDAFVLRGGTSDAGDLTRAVERAREAAVALTRFESG